MENLDQTYQSNDTISIDDEISEYFLETAKWAKFMAILGFIGIGLMVLGSLVMLVTASNSYRYNGSGQALTSFIYLLFAVFYYFPVNYLFQFATGIKDAINYNDQALFSNGIRNLKSHYKFIGISLIVILSLYLFLLFLVVLWAKKGY